MESFLVNADRLNPIIKALINRGTIPAKVDDKLLQTIGFENPSDLLVIHILKELNMVQSDNSPAPLFEKLIDKSTTCNAVAEGTVHAYGELLTQYPTLYKERIEEIQQKVSDYYEGKKTELIIKYMSNTFKKLVDYAGSMEIERVLAAKADSSSTEKIVQDMEENHASNGRLKEETPESKAEQKQEKDVESEETLEILSDKNVGSIPALSEEDDILGEELIEDTSTAEPDVCETQTEIPGQEESSPEPQSKKLQEEKPIMPKSLLNLGHDKKVQQAYIKKSDLLYKLNRYEELLPNLTEIINLFDDSSDQTFLEAVNRSIIRRGVILKKLNRTDELLPALEEIIGRFGSSENEYYYREASMAMLDKVDLLEDKGEADKLLELYEKVINRLQDGTTDDIASRVDQIFLNRVDLLYQFGNDEQTLRVLDETINRFESNGREEHFIQDALFKKAEILEQLNRDEEALEAYNEFIERFGETTNA